MTTPTNESWEKEVAGAVARGWCAPANEKKEMDSDLAYAIVAEILPLLSRTRSEAKEISDSRWYLAIAHLDTKTRDGVIATKKQLDLMFPEERLAEPN